MHAFCKICEHEIVFVFICNNGRTGRKLSGSQLLNNQTNRRNTFKILKEIWICMSGMVWYSFSVHTITQISLHFYQNFNDRRFHQKCWFLGK